MPDHNNIVPIKKGRRSPVIGPPSKQRSAVTNGTKVFLDGDQRGPWARRFNDLVKLHEEDLGPSETLSELQRSICRRVATLEIELEQMEGKLSKGEDVDLTLYRELTGTLGREARGLGLKRAARDRAPTIADLTARYQP